MYHVHLTCPWLHLFPLLDALSTRLADVITVDVLDYGPCCKSLAQAEEGAMQGFLVLECSTEVDEEVLAELVSDPRIISLSQYCVLSPASQDHPFAHTSC
jgi:hypothetical protein